MHYKSVTKVAYAHCHMIALSEKPKCEPLFSEKAFPTLQFLNESFF